ncbi:MAG: transposase family protein [Azoarcus sp.]|nr:transposase family protein [Azoarcus sp.]
MHMLSPKPYFMQVSDPRRQTKNKKHRVSDILGITLCGVLMGLEDWCSIAEFGRLQEAWLKTFLSLENGIPSHDTFGQMFSLLAQGVRGGFFCLGTGYVEVLAGTGNRLYGHEAVWRAARDATGSGWQNQPSLWRRWEIGLALIARLGVRSGSGAGESGSWGEDQ